MERIMASSMRSCLRGGHRGAQLVERSVAAGSRRSNYMTTTPRRIQQSTRSFPQQSTLLPLSLSPKSYSTTQSTPYSTTSSSPVTSASPTSDPTAVTRLLAPDHLDTNEKEIFDKINEELSPTKLDVKDISGGCGSMYGIEVESEKFRGLSMLKQQRLVNAIVKEKMDREGWHGVQLRTKVPGK